MKGMPLCMSQRDLADDNNRGEVRGGEEKSERDRKTFLLACTVDHSHPRVYSGKVGLLY